MGELAKALATFQASQTGLELDKTGNRSQYASVGSVMTKVKEAAAHGLSFTQLVDYEDGIGMHLKTYIMHTSGDEKIGRYPIAVDDMTNNQKLGSAISYARRYALMAALGLAAGLEPAAAGNAHRLHRLVVPAARHPERPRHRPVQGH